MSQQYGSPSSARSFRLALVLGAVLVLLGSVLLWWDGQREFVVYTGSYEPLEAGSEFYVGPSAVELFASVLCLLGIGGLGIAGGLAVARRSAQTRLMLLSAGILLALAGAGLLFWDYNQVRSFGWFAYAPLDSSVFSPVSAAQLWGKAALAAGAAVLGFCFGQRLRPEHAQRITG